MDCHLLRVEGTFAVTLTIVEEFVIVITVVDVVVAVAAVSFASFDNADEWS